MSFDRKRLDGLYPFKSHFLDRAGLRLHYLDEGAGDPLVLLHGNPTWSFYYRNLILGLRDSHRLIAPDHIGCGLSEKPGDMRYDYTLKSRIDDLECLIDHLGLSSGLTLVLHDWGGAIGMGFAARHPERIKRLVIMNTAAFLPPEGKPVPLTLRLARNTMLGAFLVRRFNAFAAGASYMATKNGMRREIRRGYTAPYDSWANRIATLRFVQDIPLGPSDPAYAEIQMMEAALPQFRDLPALICWGAGDFVFDLDFLAKWKSFFPSAESHVFENAGHYVLEDAADEIIPLVRGFLARHPLAQAGA